MFSKFLVNCPRFYVSSIRESLQILELSTPVTKSVIKKQYLEMAKKYHPDSRQNGQKQTQKQLQEKFVSISKAYTYLKDINQEDINNFRQTKSGNDPKYADQPIKNGQKSKKMTNEEKMRQQTYEYFDKQYTIYKNAAHGYETGSSKKKQVNLLKGAPELMIGICFLMMILGDWTYKSYKRSQKEKQYKEKQKQTQLVYTNAFKSMNMHNRYGGRIKKVVSEDEVDKADVKE